MQSTKAMRNDEGNTAPTTRFKPSWRVRGCVIGTAVALTFAAWAPTAAPDNRESAEQHSQKQANGERKHRNRGHGAEQRGRSERGKRDDRPKHRRGVPVGCGDVISEPGKYRLNTDLVCTQAIEINASNVHFDLAGHSLHCDVENWIYPDVPQAAEDPTPFVTGVQVNYPGGLAGETPVTGVRVTNGTVSGCAIGVFLWNTNDSKVTGMKLIDNQHGALNDFTYGHAMLINTGNNNQVVGNEMTGNANGLVMFNASNNKIANNKMNAQSPYDGLYLNASTGNAVRHNEMNDNAEAGMWIDPGSDNNRIFDNGMSRNAVQGVFMLGPNTGNVFRRNEVTQNQDGIVLLGIPDFGLPVPADNFFVRNTAQGNPTGDFIEVLILDYFGAFDIVPSDECFNVYRNNTFDTAVGAPDCFQ